MKLNVHQTRTYRRKRSGQLWEANFEWSSQDGKSWRCSDAEDRYPDDDIDEEIMLDDAASGIPKEFIDGSLPQFCIADIRKSHLLAVTEGSVEVSCEACGTTLGTYDPTVHREGCEYVCPLCTKKRASAAVRLPEGVRLQVLLADEQRKSRFAHPATAPVRKLFEKSRRCNRETVAAWAEGMCPHLPLEFVGHEWGSHEPVS